MDTQQVLQFCQIILPKAWHTFSFGVIMYITQFILSIILMVVSLSRFQFIRFIGGAVVCFFSLYVIWVFGTYFLTLSVDDVSSTGCSLVILSFFLSAFMGAGIAKEGN